jgi:hypothetical protein
MDMWNFVAGGAAIGLIAGFWGKIKGVLWRVANLFVQRIEIPTAEAHNALVAYLIKHYRRSRAYERLYGAWHVHRRDGKYGLVAYEQFGTRSIMFWRGWWPFIFSNAVEAKAAAAKTNQGNSGSNEDVTKVYCTLTFLRGTLNLEKILEEACAAVNQLSWQATEVESSNRSRFVIHYVPARKDDHQHRDQSSNGLAWYQQGTFRLLGITPEQLGKASISKGSALENLIFPQRVKDLIEEIELWRTSRDWYRDKGIPWKRGWLLYGPPGTGKTALARAFAEDLNMPIYVFNLAAMGNHELLKAWSELQVNVPCIALFEDIDNVFHGRDNVSRKHGMMPLFIGDNKKDDDKSGPALTPLTFDCFLNCLDGVERADGVFTIITTNDIAKVDPALGQPRKLPDGSVEFISTRPGRIDKAVELGYMEPDDKKRLAKRILGDYPDEYLAMLEFIDRYPELQETPAQFQERCGQIALACFWKEKQVAQLSDVPAVEESGSFGSRAAKAIGDGIARGEALTEVI